jgi:hypothetical protein
MTTESRKATPPDSGTSLARSLFAPGPNAPPDPDDYWESAISNGVARYVRVQSLCKEMIAKGLIPPTKEEISAAIQDRKGLDGLIERLEDKIAHASPP